MKKLIPLLGIMVVMAAACSDPVKQVQAADNETPPSIWTTDYPAALGRAKAEGKHLLLDFTGSDWCPWCIRLEREVFSQPEFQAYATNAFVLVKLDFPNRTRQPEALQAQNRKLAEDFAVEGFPTILILNSNGKPVAQTGYREGGAAPYVEHLKEILASEAK